MLHAISPYSRALLAALTVGAACLLTYPSQAQEIDDVIISEIMYHPPDVGDLQGDVYEFIELQNTGTEPVDLSGVSFASGITYTFPAGTMLDAHAFIVLAADAGHFLTKYGFEPFGVYSGALNNAGERVALADSGGRVFFEVTYLDVPPWPGAADGIGFSLVPVDPLGVWDPREAANWRASRNEGGSPGEADPPVDVLPVYVNELLAHTDPPQQDAVELYNPNEVTANIGGWYLTDDDKEPQKYQFPLGTTIPPGGYLIVDEEDFNPNPGVPPSFAFSSLGDAVYLYATDGAGNLIGYRHGFTFQASENQVSFGRHVNSVGRELFVRQRGNSFGQENLGPRPSPVVISEIMYHPPETGDEFLEIANVTNGVVPLFDPLNPTNTWKVDGIMYTFPEGILLSAGEVLLLVQVDPATFRSKYGIPESVQVLGPYTGALSNGGERLALEKPDTPEPTSVPYIEVDVVEYSDRAPWPPSPDGDGYSLQRTNLEVYADDPIYWQASPNLGGSPGNLSITRTEPGARNEIAGSIILNPAYPNPFNPLSVISFTVGDGQEVRMELVDLMGRRVRTLFEGYVPASSTRQVGVDASGLASGTYLVRLVGKDASTSRAIVVAK